MCNKNVKVTKNLTPQEFMRYFEWFWKGRRDAIHFLTKNERIVKRMKKDCNDRDRSKRRDLMNKEGRSTVEVEDIGVELDYGTRKYTLQDYVKPYVSPDKAFTLMTDYPKLGKEILNVIEPFGDGAVEVGDQVQIRTVDHLFNGSKGTLIEKRKRPFYDQYECRVQVGKMEVILREDELIKWIPIKERNTNLKLTEQQ